MPRYVPFVSAVLPDSALGNVLAHKVLDYPALVIAQEKASFGRKLGALAVDCLLAAGVAALFTRPAAPGLMSAAVFFAAYTLFIGFFGQTPGMRLFGLACLRFDDNDGPVRLSIGRAALRTVLLQLAVPAVFQDARGRGWHDRAAGSIMVRYRR